MELIEKTKLGGGYKLARKFEKGEKYRPIVTINKTRKGVPTVITVSGRRYIFDPGTVNKNTRKRGKV